MLTRIRKAMEEKEEGFTLVELLVVVIIIGILAAIAIPLYLNQQKNAHNNAVKADLHNAVTAVAAALVEHPNATSVVLSPTATSTTESSGTVTTPHTWSESATAPTGDTTVNVSGGTFTISATSAGGKSYTVDQNGTITDTTPTTT